MVFCQICRKEYQAGTKQKHDHDAFHDLFHGDPDADREYHEFRRTSKEGSKSRFSDYEVYIPLYGMADAMEGAGTAQISFSEMEKIRDVTGVEEIYAIGGSLDLESGMRQQNGNVISDMIYNDALFRWLLEQNGKSGLWNEGWMPSV